MAIRFSGILKAPVSGEYVFSGSGVSGNAQSVVRVFIDDIELLSSASAPRVTSVLEGGRSYPFRAEFRPSNGRGGGITSMQLLWTPPAGPLLEQARAVVKAADLTLAFVGLNPSLEGEEMSVNVPGFKGGDRTSLDLPAPQQALLDVAFETGKPVIVVLTSGSAVAVTSAATRARAVLAVWYGGEEIGNAIADTLTGANNPAGRLPVTFYRGVDQLPPFDDYAMRSRTYRYFTGDPLYRFGFGLSYSTFRYSNLVVQTTGSGLTVSAVVQNASARDGDEVAQIYVSAAGGSEPIRELKGFIRVHLGAGERRTLTFAIPGADLPKGRYTVRVGGGQPAPGVATVSQAVGR
jgi:beta-glucosidase